MKDVTVQAKVSKGDRVKKGQIEAELDHRDQDAPVEATKARISVTRARQAQARTQPDGYSLTMGTMIDPSTAVVKFGQMGIIKATLKVQENRASPTGSTTVTLEGTRPPFPIKAILIR